MGAQPYAALHNPCTMRDAPRILITDDEAELRALLQRYLSEQGLQVRAVGDAASAAGCWRASASTCWCSTS